MRSLKDVVNGRFVGRDIEWTEHDGSTYRGPIQGMREGEGGAVIEFELAWCARLVLDAGGLWHIHSEKSSIGLGAGFTTLVVQDDGCIEFDASPFAQGTIYPESMHLDRRDVKPRQSRSKKL